MIYVFSGKITIDNPLRVKTHPRPLGRVSDQQIRDGELALLTKGEEIIIQSDTESQFLILAGPELNEPIARYGPFVMNTQAEIHQAILDYRNGMFTN